MEIIEQYQKAKVSKGFYAGAEMIVKLAEQYRAGQIDHETLIKIADIIDSDISDSAIEYDSFGL